MMQRGFWRSLAFEKDGSLNLGWALSLLFAVVGVAGFVVVVVMRQDSSTLEKLAAWTFLIGAFAIVLIAALPIAKAKILADAKLPGEMMGHMSNKDDDRG